MCERDMGSEISKKRNKGILYRKSVPQPAAKSDGKSGIYIISINGIKFQVIYVLTDLFRREADPIADIVFETKLYAENENPQAP